MRPRNSHFLGRLSKVSPFSVQVSFLLFLFMIAFPIICHTKEGVSTMQYELQNVRQSVSLQLILNDQAIPGIRDDLYDLSIDICHSTSSFIVFKESDYFDSTFTVFPALRTIFVIDEDSGCARLPYYPFDISCYADIMVDSLSMEPAEASVLAVIIAHILRTHIMRIRRGITEKDSFCHVG